LDMHRGTAADDLPNTYWTDMLCHLPRTMLHLRAIGWDLSVLSRASLGNAMESLSGLAHVVTTRGTALTAKRSGCLLFTQRQTNVSMTDIARMWDRVAAIFDFVGVAFGRDRYAGAHAVLYCHLTEICQRPNDEEYGADVPTMLSEVCLLCAIPTCVCVPHGPCPWAMCVCALCLGLAPLPHSLLVRGPHRCLRRWHRWPTSFQLRLPPLPSTSVATCHWKSRVTEDFLRVLCD